MSNTTTNKIKIIAISMIALAIVVVVLQNTQTVETTLLFFTVEMPNAALLFGTLIIGFSIGVLTAGHLVNTAKRALPD
ncbi:MAG: LapA family protein [Pirellulales bacterium]